MFRESLLHSEIQSLMAVGPYETEMDMETGFDDQLAQLSESLYNIMPSMEGQGVAFLDAQRKSSLTGIPPMDFNSFGRVSQLRVNATTLVLEKMVPLIIQAKGFRKPAEVVKFITTHKNGAMLKTYISILVYTPRPNPGTQAQQEAAARQMVLRTIESKSKIVMEERPVPVMQTGPERTGSKNENVEAKDNPDKPRYQITGRFDFTNTIDKKDKVLGIVVSINQAGNWLEGVLSLVSDSTRVNADVPRKYLRFYALVTSWDKAIPLIYQHGDELYFQNLRMKVLNTDRVQIWYTQNGKDAPLDFNRVSSAPVLTERHLSTVNNDLIKASQWFPLLNVQMRNILSYLKDYKGYAPIHDYSDTKDSTTVRNLKIANRKVNFKQLLNARNGGDVKAMKTLYNSFVQFVWENFHESDHLLAAFYCRYYLEIDEIKAGNWRLSHLYAFSRFMNIDGHSGSTATRFLANGNDKAFKREQHIYEIEIKMIGVSGFVVFGGAGYFRGDMTVKCNKWGRGTNDQTEKYNISLWEMAAGLAAGVEVSLGKSFKAKVQTDYMWMPQDFEGSYTIGKIEAGVSGYNVAGIGGLLGMMNLESKTLRKSLTFKVYDLSANILGIEPEPQKEFESKGAKSKLGASISQSLGAGDVWNDSKHDAGAPADVLRLAEEKTEYGALYAGADKLHFKHDSALLSVGASNALRKMCANEMVLLTNSNTVVEITGHTDKSGSDEHNMKLSLNRARNVARRMKDICGASLVARIKPPEGKGETQAKGKGQGRNAPDRRVDIRINGILVLRLIG